MIPWDWLNIWLIQLPHLSHQIFMFTKTNQSHCLIPPHAISPDSNFTCTAEAPNRKETWEHELETRQHFFHWAIKKFDQQSKQCKGGWTWRWGDTSSAIWALLCMGQEHQTWHDCTSWTSSVVVQSQMIPCSWMNEESWATGDERKEQWDTFLTRGSQMKLSPLLGAFQVHCRPKLIHSCSSANHFKSWNKTIKKAKSCSEVSKGLRQTQHNKINTYFNVKRPVNF